MTQTKGRRKTVCTKTAVSGIKNENLHVCWRKQVPDRSDRILFVDQGRGRSFAVYYGTCRPGVWRYHAVGVKSLHVVPLTDIATNGSDGVTTSGSSICGEAATLLFGKGASR